MLQQLWKRLAGSFRTRPSLGAHPRRYRAMLEALEDRITPTEYWWIGPAGGNWATGAYWENRMYSPPTIGTVPGANDNAIFGTPGANTSCVVATAAHVYNVDMTSDYTATLTVAAGGSLIATTTFTEHGGLVLAGGTAGTSTSAFYANGPVSVTAAGSALAVGTDLALNEPLTVTAGSATTPGLTLTCGSLSAAGDINIGTAAGATGAMKIIGSVTQVLSEKLNVYATGWLGFVPGTQGSLFNVQGTINLYSATLDTGGAVKIDGGTLNSLAGAGLADKIVGDLTRFNGGTVNVGSSGGTVSELDMTNGSLDVPAQASLNLYAGSLLNFPPLMGTSSTLTIGGTATLYGAGITVDAARVSSIDVTGTLASQAGTATDTVTGSLTDSGSITVGTSTGGLSTLAVTATLTVASGGTATINTGCVLTAATSGVGAPVCDVKGQVDMYGGTFSGPGGTTGINPGRTHQNP